MEHEWRGDVTRAGDGDANVIFVFFRFLVFFWWDTTRFSINLVEKGKGLTFTAKIINHWTLNNMRHIRVCILHNGYIYTTNTVPSSHTRRLSQTKQPMKRDDDRNNVK